MISLTEDAVAQIKTACDEEGVTEVGGLRVTVRAGGCSGFQYSLSIEQEAAEDDVVQDISGCRVLIDPFSAMYLEGCQIDYVKSLAGSGFSFKNPNSTGGCGCGSSFSA